MSVAKGGAALIPELEPLWESLFDHHRSIGAAGIPTIPRERSWPLRRAHYERLLAEHQRLTVWLESDATGPVGYALSYASNDPGPGENRPGRASERSVAVLETLSVLPRSRGARLGSRLMELADLEARAWGVGSCVVDVMGGNERARAFYLRRGYTPHSETWMRVRPADARQTDPLDPDSVLNQAAAEAGFDLELHPGPDDTWVTPEWIVGLTPQEGLDKSRFDPVASGTFWETLERTGLWAIQITVAAPPAAETPRELLRGAGFRVSTERLARPLPPPRD